MKILKLQPIDNNAKIGKICPYIEPNIKEDTLLIEDEQIIGFYIKDISKYSKRLSSLLAIANKEFRSDNVPKTLMSRGPQGNKAQKLERLKNDEELVTQYSTILGSIAPKPHMRRPYPNMSSVHNDKKAQLFIKAMLSAALESEKIIKQIAPKIHEQQIELFKQVKDKWKFGNLFTSSISNFNIAAPYHKDTANIKGAVNVILTKRKNAKGGCLHVPDYDAVFEQCDNSMLVYPAWKNVHGVTPIKNTYDDGYRNSLIFYPLNAFIKI